MNIEQIAIASIFNLKASRSSLVALHQLYHYRHDKIPKHLQGVTSRLMDTVDAAILKDDEIQRKVRSK